MIILLLSGVLVPKIIGNLCMVVTHVDQTQWQLILTKFYLLASVVICKAGTALG